MENLQVVTQSASLPMLKNYEKSVVQAEINSKLISASSVGEFAQVVIPICAMYGIATPEAPLLKLLHEFTATNYHWATLEHFRIAFEYNAANKLERKVEHYGAMSVNFIGDVLTMYRVKRDEVKLALDKAKNEVSEEPTEEDEETAREGIKKMWEVHKHQWNNGQKGVVESMSVIIMGAMERLGMITEEMFTDAEWKTYYQLAFAKVLKANMVTPRMYRRWEESRKQRIKESVAAELKRMLYILHINR